MQHLRSLEGITGLTKLHTLRVEACRQISSLDAIAGLTELRHLSISDCRDIASLRPLFTSRGSISSGVRALSMAT